MPRNPNQALWRSPKVEQSFWTKWANYPSSPFSETATGSSGEIRPVGSTKQVPINVRILVATNRDLEQAVAQASSAAIYSASMS